MHITLDLEDGYADDPAEVATFVDRLPLAGLNIEDSSIDRLAPPPLVADKVEAIKHRRPEVFVNVRVDTFWFGQDASVEATLDRLVVRAAVAELPAIDRDLITRRYVEDQTYRRIAVALSMPEGTVKVRLHRARRQLRQALKVEG